MCVWGSVGRDVGYLLLAEGRERNLQCNVEFAESEPEPETA